MARVDHAMCSLEEAYNVRSPEQVSMKKYKGSCGSGSRTVDTFRPYGREDFTGTMGEETYNVKRHDAKYYCDNYRICNESFENPPPRSSSSKSSKMPPPPTKSCGPIQPPMYEYPVPEEAKKQYQKAVDLSMSAGQAGGATETPVARRREVDMNNVSGYYDEDLEMYLQTKDMKASPVPVAQVPKRELNAEPYDPETSPFAQSMTAFQGKLTPPPVATVPTRVEYVPTRGPVDHLSKWMDILLFFLAGILMIMICDQLLKLGMMLGMRDTIQIMTPYLKELKA